MQTSRRSFLKILGLGAPALVVAPKYFFAPVGGWRSDTIINPVQIGNGVLYYDLFEVEPGAVVLYENAEFIKKRLEAMMKSKDFRSPGRHSKLLIQTVEAQARAMATAKLRVI